MRSGSDDRERGSGGTALKVALGAALLVVLGVPFALRPEEAKVQADRKLLIISPHWEGIRTEFGRAFSEWTQHRSCSCR